MAALSSDKLLIALAGAAVVASAAVFGSLAWREASTPPPNVERVELSGKPYVPVVAEPAPIKIETWAAPVAQSRGREWIYDAFTPPEIYYNARTKQFTVRPPSSLADEESEEAFGIELIAVRPEPFRLQLIGFAGDEGNWRGMFENLLTGEIIVAAAGRRVPNLALTIKSLEVQPQPILLPQSMTTRQRVATAVVHDERIRQDVTLTHRERKFTGTVTAFIAVAGQKGTREVRPDDVFPAGNATYRVHRIQLSPPVIEISKEKAGGAAPDRRTLHPHDSEEGFTPEAEDER